jgi:hypothetical protein
MPIISVTLNIPVAHNHVVSYHQVFSQLKGRIPSQSSTDIYLDNVDLTSLGVYVFDFMFCNPKTGSKFEVQNHVYHYLQYHSTSRVCVSAHL